MLINIQTLAILAIWATTTKATSAVTISTTVPVSTTAPLSDCSSICKLMESKIAPNPDPNSTLFTSLCNATGRDDCEAIQTRFSIDLAPASGDKLSFKCICKRNDPAGVEGTSTEESTTTSTTTITSTVWTTSPSVYATSSGTTTITPVGETSVGSSTTVGIATSTSVSGTKTTLGTSVVSSTTAPTAVLSSSFVNAALSGSGVVSKSKPKAGTIAGIVIGVLVMLAVIGVGAVLIRRRRMQKEENKEFTNSIIEPERSRYSSYRQSRNMF